MMPYRVLIVDDHPRLRELYRLCLAEEPVLQVVAEANDGVEGVKLAREHAPDLVILDLSMPNRDGLQALQDLKRSLPQARIAVVSGFTRDRVEPLVLQMGANAYVEKGLPAMQIAPTFLGIARMSPAPVRARFRPSELESRVRALV